MAYRIVITGAPASGKTDILKRLKEEPALGQFNFFDEMARILLEENLDYRSRWAEFHRQIYHRQVKREDLIKGASFISDRGTVDTFAFYPNTAQEVKTTISEEYLRYDAVFHLESAAALGEQYYNRDAIRNETLSEALEIDQAVAQVWQAHPGYCFIKASQSITEKYNNLLNALLSFIKNKN